MESLVFKLPHEPIAKRHWWSGSGEWLRCNIGRVLNRFRVPGAIRDADIQDHATGQNIRVRVRARFTEISIDGLEYRFDRLSGQFSGSGRLVPSPFDWLPVGTARSTRAQPRRHRP
jgi:hypothetical protein